MIRIFYLYLIINFSLMIECQADQVGIIMDKCASKPMTNDIYVCLSEESSILNKQYEESFKNLLIKIKNEKKIRNKLQ